MNVMPMDLDQEALAELLSVGQSCASNLVEIVQRVIIIAADVVLIFMAASAMWSDSRHSCDEPLHFYGCVCVFLCLLDIILEIVRCSFESSLDRLQANRPPPQTATWGRQGNENLLDSDDTVGQLRLSPSMDNARSVSPAICSEANPIRHVRQEKSSLQKRTRDLQCWSIFFTCFVSVLFSFFSAHDVDCEINSPSLYNYVHNFTYVFILRLGVIFLGICCRTVKNYEDSFATNGTMSLQQGAQLATF